MHFKNMKKHICRTIIFFICVVTGGAHELEWNFSYLKLQNRLISEKKPELKYLLEKARHLIEQDKIYKLSQLLQKKISVCDLSTNDCVEFEYLYIMLMIDSAADYYLRGLKRQGAQKMYIMSYLLSRMSYQEFNTNKVDPETAKEHPYLITSPVVHASIFRPFRGDTFWYFTVIAQFMPIFGFGEWFDPVFTEEEIGHNIKDYYNQEDDSKPEFYLSIPLELIYDDIVEKLFYFNDFSEDIRIFCTPGVRHLCQDAVDLVAPGIPVLDIRDDEISRMSEGTNDISICVTFRKEKAEMFFKRYYGVK
ncbi:MAG: hypothetical protein LBU85_03180 [Treponema sp.]|nr:hypothetical protein [Treponema sp.]